MAADDALRDRRLAGSRDPPAPPNLRSGGGPCPSSKGRAHPRARQNVEEHLTTTRALPRLLTAGAALVFVAAACSSPGASTAPSTAAGGGPEWTPDATLLAAAKAEGSLNTIALPRDWCNYGQLL